MREIPDAEKPVGHPILPGQVFSSLPSQVNLVKAGESEHARELLVRAKGSTFFL